jgi:hypothetical protein
MNAEEQFKFVAEFDWDDSLEPIEHILDSPVCVFETALRAFWRLEGLWYYTGVQRHHHHSSLLDRLARDIEANRYRRSDISYNPISEQRLSRVQVYKLRRAGLFDVFFGGAADLPSRLALTADWSSRGGHLRKRDGVVLS